VGEGFVFFLTLPECRLLKVKLNNPHHFKTRCLLLQHKLVAGLFFVLFFPAVTHILTVAHYFALAIRVQFTCQHSLLGLKGRTYHLNMHYVLKEIIPWHCSIENRISVMVE
jgi:hypothetical protein